MKFPRILLVLGVLAAIPALRADNPTAPAAPSAPAAEAPKPEHVGRRERWLDPDRRVAHLDRALGGTLTADQKAKIREIYATNIEKAKEDMQKAKDTMQENRRSAVQAQREQVRAVLTPDQQKKFDEMPRPHRPGDSEEK